MTPADHESGLESLCTSIAVYLSRSGGYIDVYGLWYTLVDRN